MHRRATELAPTPRLNWRIIRTLLPFVALYKGRAFLAVVLLLIAKVATVTVPLVLRAIVDALDATLQPEIVLPLALVIAYGALRLGSSLFRELQDTLFSRVRYGIMRHIAIKVVRHLHNLSLRFHLDRQTGAVARDISRGTNSLSTLLNYLLFNIVPTLVEISLVVIIVFSQYDIRFSLIILATFVAYVTLTLMFTEWRMKFRVAMNQRESAASSHAIDGLINYETVQFFGNADYEIKRYDKMLQQWEESAVKSQSTLSLLNAGQGTVIAIGVTLLMLLASREVVDGVMTIGDLVAINAFLLQLFIPLGFLGTVYSILKHSLVDMERMFELLQLDPEITDLPDARELVVKQGRVRFENVCFSYESNRPILFDVDFTIQPGSKIAIVGPSGAGKSTISRLLFRFYDVTAGKITIDDQNIQYVTQDSLRQVIGVVPQDTVLFNDTIYTNISYGNLNASRDEVIKAAKMANLHEFIESLPQKYETVVGERGLKLSGGEKQRVAIARAILKNPPIMIFDEATSSLDSESEKSILQALTQVAAHHTSLVIAHRLSTIIDADEIIVLDAGRIKERGTHEELLDQDGAYARMWRLQQQPPENPSPNNK